MDGRKMMLSTARTFALAGLLLAVPFLARQSNAQQIVSQPPDAFVTVNGVRLHYFDWGGRGQTVLMLTPLGGTGHGFDSFAPRFTDRFHVFVLTRGDMGALPARRSPLLGEHRECIDVTDVTQNLAGFRPALRIIGLVVEYDKASMFV